MLVLSDHQQLTEIIFSYGTVPLVYKVYSTSRIHNYVILKGDNQLFISLAVLIIIGVKKGVSNKSLKPKYFWTEAPDLYF